MVLDAHGMSVTLPAAWDGRIFGREVTPLTEGPEPLVSALSAGPLEKRMATLHAANFALPFKDGQFGTRATTSMPLPGAFLAMTEYRPSRGLTAGRGLFAPVGVPRRLRAADFSPATLLVQRPRQAGFQHFFTADGRPFCLYAVIGSMAEANRLVPQLNRVLGSLRVRQAR